MSCVVFFSFINKDVDSRDLSELWGFKKNNFRNRNIYVGDDIFIF